MGIITRFRCICGVFSMPTHARSSSCSIRLWRLAVIPHHLHADCAECIRSHTWNAFRAGRGDIRAAAADKHRLSVKMLVDKEDIGSEAFPDDLAQVLTRQARPDCGRRRGQIANHAAGQPAAAKAGFYVILTCHKSQQRVTACPAAGRARSPQSHSNSISSTTTVLSFSTTPLHTLPYPYPF